MQIAGLGECWEYYVTGYGWPIDIVSCVGDNILFNWIMLLIQAGYALIEYSWWIKFSFLIWLLAYLLNIGFVPFSRA